jgi:hypothetical protein
MPEEVRSLWEQYHSEVEPWRRGRLVLILIGALNFVLQGFTLTAHVALGNIELLLTTVSGFVVFWLQFYLIWIGINWVRWIAAAWCGLVGFAFLIWGWSDGSNFLVVFGCTNLIVGSYLGLSPSVYFFAKRQREKRNWIHSLSVAGIFCLMFLSFFMGSIGLSGYKAQIEADGNEFADEAFRRIFTNHDTEFVLDRMTERGLAASGGHEQMTKFLENTTLQAGDVHDIKRATARLKLTYDFPANFSCTGTVTAQGIGAVGPVQLRLDIIQSDQDWQIESLSWRYPSYPSARR